MSKQLWAKPIPWEDIDMIGIYMITNKINGKQYIGQAQNIAQRWSAHRTHYAQETHKRECPKLYAAINKYGIENFVFEVLEDCSSNPNINLTEREDYYIRKYDTVRQGYNCVYPTEVLKGENNPNASLTAAIVDQIRFELIHTNTSQQDIAKKYNVAASSIYRINRGEMWYSSEYVYPLRSWNDLARRGEKSGKSKLTDEEVMIIRQRYVHETPREIWVDYQDKYSLSGFSKVCRGETYAHLPYYHKDSKTWIYPL